MLKLRPIDEILSTEIKKDIADRYFGFRKLIEEDKLGLAEKIGQYSFILEKRISFDLIRIYVLLKDAEIIRAFLALSNLKEQLFYDPYLTESPTIARRVLSCQNFTGFTRAGRFKNYLLHCYESLSFHARTYHEKISELEQQRGAIVEEIRLFYEQNDLNAILGFLQSLSNARTCCGMEGGMEPGLAEGLDNKMLIEPPMPIAYTLPVIPELKPLAEIQAEFKKLIKQAFALQRPEILEMFSHDSTPCHRREGEYE